MSRWRAHDPPLYAPSGARLDRIDLTILRRLQEDAHLENRALAREVGLSDSGCLLRVRRLEEGGAICGYSAVTDDSMFAAWSMLWIQIKLRGQAQDQRSQFEMALDDAPDVIEAHDLAGRFDYLVKAALPSLSAWCDLRVRIDPCNAFIKAVDILPSVRTVKRKSLHPLLSVAGALG